MATIQYQRVVAYFKISHSTVSVKLHLFNPENDLALGLGCRNYTPPPHAAAIHRAGALLPMWWAEDGDMILADPMLAAEAERLKDTFCLCGEIYDSRQANARNVEPHPWGWSLDAKRQFATAGVSQDHLPTDKEIERLRQLSHRRMTMEIIKELGGDFPLPTEITDAAQVVAAEKATPGCFIKSPWSGSGRGVFCARSLDEATLCKRAEGIIHRQGSVMVERGLDKVLDFAALFHSDGGEVRFKGWSVFRAESRGMYCGNIVAPQDQLKTMITDLVSSGYLDSVIGNEEKILGGLIGNSYRGWLGVDMMVYREDDAMKLMPCIELNLRMTMGVVALKMQEKLSVSAPHLLSWQLGANSDCGKNSTILLPPTSGFTLSLKPLSDRDQESVRQ